MGREDPLGHRYIGSALARTYTPDPGEAVMSAFRDAIGYPLREPNGSLSFPWRDSSARVKALWDNAGNNLPSIFAQFGAAAQDGWHDRLEAAIQRDAEAERAATRPGDQPIYGGLFNTVQELTAMFQDAIDAKTGKGRLYGWPAAKQDAAPPVATPAWADRHAA